MTLGMKALMLRYFCKILMTGKCTTVYVPKAVIRCMYNKSLLTGRKRSLPQSVATQVNKLSEIWVTKTCCKIHGRINTNPTESVNTVIWQNISIPWFLILKPLEFQVYNAVVQFNGYVTLLTCNTGKLWVLEELGIEQGKILEMSYSRQVKKDHQKVILWYCDVLKNEVLIQVYLCILFPTNFVSSLSHYFKN